MFCDLSFKFFFSYFTIVISFITNNYIKYVQIIMKQIKKTQALSLFNFGVQCNCFRQQKNTFSKWLATPIEE